MGYYNSLSVSTNRQGKCTVKVNGGSRTVVVSVGNRRRGRKPQLPSGTFRAPRDFHKSFNWVGSDGNTYYFDFTIKYEQNCLDNGYGGAYATGYFIHINKAPRLDVARELGHYFHIIKSGAYDQYICWNKALDDFQEANAVMIVWVKRYVAFIIELKKYNFDLSEEEVMRKVHNKGILPTGTFRGASRRKRSKTSFTLRNVSLPKKKTIYIAQEVYDAIMARLSKQKPELGGMLGFRHSQDVIDEFVFDGGAKVGSAEYSPNTKYLNDVMANEWNDQGINFAGFVHSHPGSFNVPSSADVEYAVRIMDAFEMGYIFMPIVTSSYAYKGEFNPYIITCDGRVEKCELVVCQDVKVLESEETGDNIENILEDIDADLLASIEAGFDKMQRKTRYVPLEQAEEAHELQDEMFDRIKCVIDVEHMSECSIIAFGCGGARGFYEDMSRMGVGNFFLMDGDVSSKSNIASQNGFISEIGMPKVDAVKRRLLDINDEIEVHTFNCMLDGKITDKWLKENIFNKIDVKKAIICAFTDDFNAQSISEEIARRYGIPYLAAQHHQYGDTSELVYWYPGVSTYTAKKVLKSRYDAYANGYKNTVTSVGSPIFNTTRLNALCAQIATGILVYSANPDSIYATFLKDKPDFNLILIKQKDLSASTSGLAVCFEDTFKSDFAQVLWLHGLTFADEND